MPCSLVHHLVQLLILLLKLVQGANATDRASIPEENKQIFFMSNDILDTQKGDLAWASYALLRNTNSMSVVLF